MLTVKETFTLGDKSYQRGTRITDAAEVAAVLESNRQHVLQTYRPPAESTTAEPAAPHTPEPESDLV
jgi:hypothetical protein